MAIVRTQGSELAVTIFAFEINESLGLLDLRLTCLSANRQHQLLTTCSESRVESAFTHHDNHENVIQFVKIWTKIYTNLYHLNVRGQINLHKATINSRST